MTRLRKMMLEELERRNYSEATTRCYIRTVEDFSRRFNCSPDCLGPEHIREYQAELFKKRQLSPGTVTQRLAALRFFYIKTLKKAWSIADTPYPKRAFHLPSILSREEVAQLIDAALTPFHRTLLMTIYATGVRRAELTHLKISDIDSKRMVIHVQGGKGRKDRDVMLSPKLLEALREHWRGLRHKPSTCFQATAGIPVIGRSPPRWSGTLARKPPSERASRKMCTPILCGTASPLIYLKQARIYEPSRCC
jgi:integrase/recombinase XerD